MKTQFVTDNDGDKLAVILLIKEYSKMVEELEKLEDIKLYDRAKAENEPSIPIDDAFKMIEQERKNKK